ncbi:uncharacterized protein LOC126855708 [Cataglyphis hispanica]|uniref:uncharacterized protein LOC126855708 n=1 Tax=Cataglyphis hispanica TaxID=1086592 RepID=UPI0021801ACB|nr:uncharacterized protein LOC126855708 [Cataglyphis hispanica]
MTTITCLPDEVIAVILSYNDISIEDVVSFISTCKRFHRALLDRKFWERKFYLRCCAADEKYEYKHEREKLFRQFDFKDLIKKSLMCIKKLYYYISVISNDNFIEARKKKLFSLLHFISKNDLICCLVVEEILQKKYFTSNSIWTNGKDLTHDYNSTIFIRYLKLYSLKYNLEKYAKKPKKKQLLEEVLTIVVQYFHPYISYTFIDMWINDIVHEVLEHLIMSHHKHSIFKKTSEDFSIWSEDDTIPNYWNEMESKQIMDTLEKFVFSQLDDHFYMNFSLFTDIFTIIHLSRCCKKARYTLQNKNSIFFSDTHGYFLEIR